MAGWAGGCLCGDIRYVVTAEPVAVALCHCRNCQKQSGSSRSLNWLVPAGSLEITGTVATYEDRGDSGGIVSRQFCPRCGSPIRSLIAAMPGVEALKAGTLDETPDLAPHLAIFTANEAGWETRNADWPRFVRAQGG